MDEVTYGPMQPVAIGLEKTNFQSQIREIESAMEKEIIMLIDLLFFGLKRL